MTIGIAVFGTLQTRRFSDRLHEIVPGAGTRSTGSIDLQNLDPQQLFQSGARSIIPAEHHVVTVLSGSIVGVFGLTLIPIAVAVVPVLFMGNARAASSREPQVSGHRHYVEMK
ncbi:hypothetical protein [Cohnella caldifontis]|uniref:hypothetical protein n=1 Tax=Cohnella caldifontis TaxID=3027471 RepID=UPI0023EAD527|nr:hypothetical protein [Cohnella sp. YIM B05605]